MVTPQSASAAAMVMWLWVTTRNCCAGAEPAEQPGEAEHVAVVEGGVDLVEDVERARIHLLEGQHHGQRGQGSLAAAEQAERRLTLARRLGEDLDAGATLGRAVTSVAVEVERHGLGLLEAEGRPAPREQLRVELLEVERHRAEHGVESLLDLALEVASHGAQRRRRRGRGRRAARRS